MSFSRKLESWHRLSSATKNMLFRSLLAGCCWLSIRTESKCYLHHKINVIKNLRNNLYSNFTLPQLSWELFCRTRRTELYRQKQQQQSSRFLSNNFSFFESRSSPHPPSSDFVCMYSSFTFNLCLCFHPRHSKQRQQQQGRCSRLPSSSSVLHPLFLLLVEYRKSSIHYFIRTTVDVELGKNWMSEW